MKTETLRPFLTQSDLPSKTVLFDWSLNRAFFGLFSIEFSGGSVSRKTPSKMFSPIFFNQSHCSSHHKTHTHTPTHTYQVEHSSIIQQRWRCLGCHCFCFSPQVSVEHSKLTPSSARQQRVSHDSSSARYRCHFANNGYAHCSIGGSRLIATPRT